jgi:hypothetical protein
MALPFLCADFIGALSVNPIFIKFDIGELLPKLELAINMFTQRWVRCGPLQISEVSILYRLSIKYAGVSHSA